MLYLCMLDSLEDRLVPCRGIGVLYLECGVEELKKDGNSGCCL
jgi:hypothetical protein